MPKPFEQIDFSKPEDFKNLKNCQRKLKQKLFPKVKKKLMFKRESRIRRSKRF